MMDDAEFEAELVADLKRDILKHEKRAAEHEEDALKCRRSAEGCRAAIEYIKKRRDAVNITTTESK
jgi:hypothetical protein